MRKLARVFWPYGVIFLVSAVLIFPYWKQGFILAMGESQIYLNPSYINPYFLWTEKLSLGRFSPSQVYIVLSAFFTVLRLLPFGIHPSIVFIFLSFFLPATFFYYVADKIVYEKHQAAVLCGSIIYSFNIFRVLGALNECQNSLFIFLPLFFLFYYRLLQTKKWKYVFTIILISVLSSILGANLPLFFIPYLTMFFYFIYYFLSNKFKIEKILIIQNYILLLLIILVHCYWLFPIIFFLTDFYISAKDGVIPFTTYHAGKFFDHFRFIGLWAWREKHKNIYYYPYALVYDGFFMAFSTYLIAIFSFIFFIKKNKNYLENLLLFLIVVSYILLSGTKGPIGFIYAFLFDNLVFFKIYRDPFMKFNLIYIFAVSFALIFSLSLFYKKLKNEFLSLFISSLVVSVILINAYPLFNRQALPVRVWNAGQSSYMIKIPEYWIEAKHYIEKKLINERLTILPFNNYSNSHNWEYGINVVGNIADYLIDVPTIKSWGINDGYSGKTINALLDLNNKDIILKKSMGIFNSRYLLQENDVEWRYSGGAISSPSASTNFIAKNGLKKIAEFGRFTKEYLKKIPNGEKNNKLRDELYKELTNQPALILYQMDNKYYLPRIYIPRKIITATNESQISELIANEDFIPGTAVYFPTENLNKILPKKGFKIDNKLNLTFKKISPTKYTLIVNSAKSSFPIVFSESFHPGWELRSGRNTVKERYHSMVNGFANSWLINPQSVCIKSKSCHKNSDGSYYINFTIEFYPQKYLNISFIISGIVAIFSILYIAIDFGRSLSKNTQTQKI